MAEVGVDLFFLISGFLMVTITSSETRPRDFIIARLQRIIPAYWIATSVFLAGALIGLFPDARLDTWHTVSSYLFLPDRGPGTTEVWPLLVPGWTLNYKMFFYAFFTLTLALPARGNSRLLVLAVILLALAGGGAWFHPKGDASEFYTRSILLEFLAGALLGDFWKRRGAPPGGWGLKAAGVIGIGPALAILLGVVACVIGGVVAYYVIEMPFQAWFWRRRAAVPAAT